MKILLIYLTPMFRPDPYHFFVQHKKVCHNDSLSHHSTSQYGKNAMRVNGTETAVSLIRH